MPGGKSPGTNWLRNVAIAVGLAAAAAALYARLTNVEYRIGKVEDTVAGIKKQVNEIHGKVCVPETVVKDSLEQVTWQPKMTSSKEY